MSPKGPTRPQDKRTKGAPSFLTRWWRHTCGTSTTLTNSPNLHWHASLAETATLLTNRWGERDVITFDKNIAEINIFQVEGVTYCGCPNKKSSVYGVVGDKCADSDTCWAPFLERKDVIVWRREHHQHRGLYAYKVKRLLIWWVQSVNDEMIFFACRCMAGLMTWQPKSSLTSRWTCRSFGSSGTSPPPSVTSYISQWTRTHRKRFSTSSSLQTGAKFITGR